MNKKIMTLAQIYGVVQNSRVQRAAEQDTAEIIILICAVLTILLVLLLFILNYG